jgi:halimadienyl-diphosphate synthase
MSSLAYDTAWVARLVDIDSQLSNRALDWICANQLPDGSWGALAPVYYHDRVLSTLSAMIALVRTQRACDQTVIERGTDALDRIIRLATGGLQHDPNGATVGFEMIAPTMVEEAKGLGLLHDQGQHILGRISAIRQKKLKLLAGRQINRHLTAAFSTEMAGLDGLTMLDILNLKEDNGSVGHSPAATAYYLLTIDARARDALSFLYMISNPDNGIPDLVPFDVFETAWSIWNLSLADWDTDTLSSFKPKLDYLWNVWQAGKGVGLSADYPIPDGDDTSVTYEILARAGYDVDIEAVLSFEEEAYFRTYSLEANSSLSVNVHALGALRQAGYKADDPRVMKVCKYLIACRNQDFWFDKWHLSPYYTTAHAVIAAAGYTDDLAHPSMEWILATQREDGSWGRHMATAEETAYCIQALSIWKRHNKIDVGDRIHRAAGWLEEHLEKPYPPLWIGKGLYCPEVVVDSAILSALKLAKQG